MIVIHGTKKILDRLRVEPTEHPPECTGSFGAWYFDLKIVNRQHIMFAFNPATCLTIVMLAREYKDIPDTFPITLGAVLRSIGVHSSVIDNEWMAFNDMCYMQIDPQSESNQSVMGPMNHAFQMVKQLLLNEHDHSFISERMSAYMNTRALLSVDMSKDKLTNTSTNTNTHTNTHIIDNTHYEVVYPYEAVGRALGVPTHPPMRTTRITYPDTLEFIEGYCAALVSMPLLIQPATWIDHLSNHVYRFMTHVPLEMVDEIIGDLMDSYDHAIAGIMGTESKWMQSFVRNNAKHATDFVDGYQVAMCTFFMHEWNWFLLEHPHHAVMLDMLQSAENTKRYTSDELVELVKGLVRQIHEELAGNSEA